MRIAKGPKRQYSSSPIRDIPLHRRVQEVMIHKNMSIRGLSVAGKLLFSRELLRRMINGERVMTNLDLVEIAGAMKITAERLTGTDIEADRELLFKMATVGTNYRLAVEIGEKLRPVALGASEQFDILYALGRSYLGMKEYEKAHECMSEAYVAAKFLHEEFGDKERHFSAIKALAVTARWMHDYLELENRLKEAESLFADEIGMRAQLTHLKALNSYLRGDSVGAQRFFGQTLEMHRLSGDSYQIGKVLYDMAVIAMKRKQFKEAKGMLLESIACFSSLGLLADKLLSIKDLVIALYHRGEREEAVRYIESVLSELTGTELVELQGKFLFLLTHLTGDVSHAEKATQLRINDDLRHDIATYLVQSYLLAGESEKAVQYSKVVKETSHTLFMDKEGF